MSDTTNPGGRVLRPAQVADLLGVHRNTLRRWAAAGLLQPIRMGPRALGYPLAAVEAYLIERASKS